MIRQWWNGDSWSCLIARGLIVVAFVALVAHWAAGCYVERVARLIGAASSATMHAARVSRWKEVKNVERNPVLALLACWGLGLAGCAPPSGAQLADAGAPGVRTRFQQSAGAQSATDAAAFDFAPPSDGAGYLPETISRADVLAAIDAELADLAPPEPFNVSGPLPAASVAWVSSLEACGSLVIRGYGKGIALGEDRCEGQTIKGVRCVECASLDGSGIGAKLTGCRSTGSCLMESTALVCVADCLADCERARRYCAAVPE